MCRNKLDEDATIQKFIHGKIQCPDAIESLMTLEEGVFKMPIDSCIKDYRGQ